MTAELRILTVRNPWAWAIIHGQKDVENRVRNVAGGFRGPVAIHVALQYARIAADVPALDDAMDDYFDEHPEAWDDESLRPWLAGFGAIIGVVDLTDVHGVMMTGGRWHCENVEAPTDPATSGACSRWADLGALHLSLANPRPLVTPIPYKGALGLRRLPEDVAAAVWAEVAS